MTGARWAALALVVGARTASADGLADDDLWGYRVGAIAIDGGVLAALPAALETGLARGFDAGVTVGNGLQWGARVSWATATESTIGWTVTHDDVRLRLTGGWQAHAGRGAFGLRLGLGGTMVHELRRRVNGEIAGAQGMALETTANVVLPAGELDAVVSLHVTGGWMVILAGGPTVTRVDGKLRTGFAGSFGVAWQL